MSRNWPTASRSPEDAKPDDPPVLLGTLLDDLVTVRRQVQRLACLHPDDASLHRVNGMYADRILDALKAVERWRHLDREQLLLDALNEVVLFLQETGESDCAQVLGRHLETIGSKVQERWKLPAANSVKATAGSANALPANSLLSVPQVNEKNKSEGKTD